MHRLSAKIRAALLFLGRPPLLLSGKAGWAMPPPGRFSSRGSWYLSATARRADALKLPWLRICTQAHHRTLLHSTLSE